ncbi:hypothetical protein GYMLUDRAFT_914343 [Collybiopsis luxurians FD-317 M1]|nr:hypothetical protein GYMLUDRAFT_914343 [Collybiopsis luxurians FD-317 M1]
MVRLTSSTLTSRRKPDGDMVSHFQQNFCSNFVCIGCYVHLPSLHDLLDHVDEAHLGGPNASQIWPPQIPPLHQQRLLTATDRLPPSPALSDSSQESVPLSMVYSTQPSIDDISPYEDTFRLDYFTMCDEERPPQLGPLRCPLSSYERSERVHKRDISIDMGMATEDPAEDLTAVAPSEYRPTTPEEERDLSVESEREHQIGPIRSSRRRSRGKCAEALAVEPLKPAKKPSQKIEGHIKCPVSSEYHTRPCFLLIYLALTDLLFFFSSYCCRRLVV